MTDSRPVDPSGAPATDDDGRLGELPIEAAQILLFARAIGDERLVESLDLGQPSAIAVPPTFTETLQHFIPRYRMRPQPDTPWLGSSGRPTGAPDAEVSDNALHAEQHFEYHRPVRVGMTLTASTAPGRTWDKEGRSGRLSFEETIVEFRDTAGVLVVTSRSIAVRVLTGDPQ